MQLRIIDVSHRQGTVDWAKVLASGVAGGICKASEGQTFKDGRFKANWAALGRAGAVRGAYHFARPESSSGRSQAVAFLEQVGQPKPSDLLVLDLEAGSGDLSRWSLDFLGAVEQATGIRPWFYSGPAFIKAHITDGALARHPLWLARYRQTPPDAPRPWTAWRLWQHTDKATVAGVAGHVDESFSAISGLLTEPEPGRIPVATPEGG
jgi:lysozyme